jgi:hypothetical protein
MQSERTDPLVTRHSQAQNTRSAATSFGRFLAVALKDAALMPKGEILQLQGDSRFKRRSESGSQQRKGTRHGTEHIRKDLQLPSSQIDRDFERYNP